jgi:alanine racemase
MGRNVTVIYNQDEIHFTLPFAFEIWVENAFHVITAGLLLSIDPKYIQKGLNEMRPVKMRLEVKNGKNDCYLIDDSYNNDLQGLKVALDYLDRQNQKKKRSIILSDLLQAGMSVKELYHHVSELLSKHQIHRLIGVGPDISSQHNIFESGSLFFDNTKELLRNLPEFRDEVILIKGARPFGFEQLVQELQAKSHRTRLEINFERIAHNLNAYSQLISPSTRMMVMVKAFAYGGGLKEIANFLQYQGVDYLGVAFSDEAIELRDSGIDLPILVLNPSNDQMHQLWKNNIDIEIYNFSGLHQVVKMLPDAPAIHIKLETGMNRLGFTKDQIPELKNLLEQYPEIRIQGIFTHFASSSDPEQDDFTRQQATIFNSMYGELSAVLKQKPLKHASNSSAITRWPEYHFDMVRLGIGVYGFDPTGEMDLRHVGRLSTRVTQLKKVRKGNTIGYSRKGLAVRDMTIAIVPVGYADGYLRIFGNGNGKMKINGYQAPTVGNICMDMTMLDVTEIDCEEGDEVIVFGEDPSIVEMARWANTIPYEILTNLSSRVDRIYLSE